MGNQDPVVITEQELIETVEGRDGSNGYVRAEDLPEMEKDVEIDDRKYLIRKLSYEQVVQLQGAMVDVTQMAVDAKQKRGTDRLDPKTGAAMRRLAMAGLIKPTLVDDPKKGKTPHNLPVQDLMILAGEIMKLAGATRKTGERVLP